jgi:predicted protein tyrosine phosphatase
VQPERASKPDGRAGVRLSCGIVNSAGLNNDAENPTTPELVAWADVIFVMEKAHRNRLGTRFKP